MRLEVMSAGNNEFQLSQSNLVFGRGLVKFNLIPGSVDGKEVDCAGVVHETADGVKDVREGRAEPTRRCLR